MKRSFLLQSRSTAMLAPLALCGCAAVGPNYETPSVAVPATFSEARHDAAVPLNEAEIANWWRRFADPSLDNLIASALENNKDLQEAASRIREARAREVVAGASQQPRLGFESDASRTRLSENGALDFTAPGQTPPGLPGTSFSTFRIGFDASWEMDLWGGARRGIEAAEARTQAEQWNGRSIQVSLTAEVARQYFELRALQRRADIANEALARQRATAELLAARARNGIISSLETEQQRRQVERAAAAIPPLQAEENVRIHMLALLLGRFPQTLSLGQGALPTSLPPAIPAGLPSDLLRRRPDIQAAERSLAAATADIGVAVANLYPRFSLTGTFQLVSTSLASLISADSIQAVIGGAVNWPILDGGRNRANVDIAQERRTQALIAYERSILVAFKDVEDALSRYQREGERVAALERSATAAREAVDTSRVRYRNGLTPFLDVLEGETALLAVEDELAASQAQQIQHLVSFYKALGGGWNDERAAPAPAGGRK